MADEMRAVVVRAHGGPEVLEMAVHQLTSGKGAEVVFDSVAGPDFARSFRMTRNEGTVVLCGRAAGEPDLALVADDLIGGRRNLALREFYLGTHIGDHFGLGDGTLRIPITAFALDDVAQAHVLLEGGGSTGKLVLNP